MLNHEYVGKTAVSAGVYDVGVEKLKEFAAAIPDTYYAFRSSDEARAAGHADLPAPPTFAGIVTAGSAARLLFDPKLNLDYTRVVHGEQRFRHIRSIVAGDRLTSRSRIESIRAVGRNEFVETVTEILDADGQVVCIATNVIVSRGTAGDEVVP